MAGACGELPVAGAQPGGGGAASRDRGSGLIGSLAGLLAAVLFTAFSAQLLIGLYATTTVRATLHDAASRGANEMAASTPGRLDVIAADAERSLGRMGERTSIELWVEDADGDGRPDVVVGRAVSVPPRLVPPSVGGMVGFEEIRVGVRVRVERPR